MSAPVPAHLAGLSEPLRAAIVAKAAADHAADPGPPLSPATLEALRVLLRRPTPARKVAA